MNRISDGTVDAVYRRGAVDLITHARSSTSTHTYPSARRVPILIAIVGLGIPLAALAAMAFIVIAGHAHPTATPPVATTSAPAIGHTTHITDSNGLNADVTIEKVRYAKAGVDTLALSPRSGYYAIVDVLISTPSGVRASINADEFTAANSRFDPLMAQLQQATRVHDTAMVAVLQPLVDQELEQLASLARQLLPVDFTYRTAGGATSVAFSGNALASGYSPVLLAAGGLPPGTTYGYIVFDVPSTGGVIQMTDPFSHTVGTWTLPSMSSPSVIENASVGQTIHVADSQGRLADVTIESVTYATTGSGTLSQRPQHGYFAIANVRILTTGGIATTTAADGLDPSLQARVNQLATELHLAGSLGDTSLVAELTSQIALVEQEFATQAQFLPLAFTYQTADGVSYAADSGNALTSGFADHVVFGDSLDLASGTTSGQIIFDVPSKGGRIQMSDPLSGVVGVWTLPAS